MKTKNAVFAGFVLLAIISFVGTGCREKADSLVDDGGGRKPEDFPEIAFDVFKPMDGGIELSPDEIKGRNTWNLWCGGTEQFWDRMAREGFGLFDLLKTLDSRKRSARFKELGLINQPGFKQASKPDKYGLWIDEAVEPEPGNIDPKVYGYPSGVMGFRLFDNPDFTADAASKWDANKYYNDRGLRCAVRSGETVQGRHLVRLLPHCVSSDASASGSRQSKWENLASAIGNQYIREGRVFGSNVRPGGFFWEMFTTQPAGTSDTSRIATDNINNPNAINPIFDLNARLSVAAEEKLGTPRSSCQTPKPVSKVPHVLKDGADSVGVIGATRASLRQYWQLLSALAATAQRAHRIEEAEALRHRNSAKELCLLARHAAEGSQCREVLHEGEALPAGRRAGRESVCHQERKDHETRQGCFC